MKRNVVATEVFHVPVGLLFWFLLSKFDLGSMLFWIRVDGFLAFDLDLQGGGSMENDLWVSKLANHFHGCSNASSGFASMCFEN